MKLAVIPARGGSKRIPRKNVKPFAGRPMIGWAIAAARDSGVFDRFVVSTDDEEIAAIARAEGAEVPFMRPAALADDHAGTAPVIVHAMDEVARQGVAPQLVCCIYPCVPLLAAQDLAGALSLLEDSDAGFVFPVLAFASPVQRAMRRDAQGAVQPMFPEHVNTRSQDLPPAYHDAGQFYWGRADAWRSGRSPHEGGRSIVVPASRAVDIDTPDDWALAEAIFAVRRPGGR